MKNTMTSRTARANRHDRPSDALSRYLRSGRCDELVRQYVDASLAGNTLRAYRSDLNHFIAWGGSIPSSQEELASYVAHHANTLAYTTLSRHLIAIARAHAAEDLESPTRSELVRATLQGVRRSSRKAIRQVAPLQKEQVLAMVRRLSGLRGLRDTALLLIGFSAALRRSELVSLNVEDVRFTDEGTVLRLRRSKTDQNGEGRDIAIPFVHGRYCPSRSLLAWLHASGITSGALFCRIGRYDQMMPQRLSAQSVALIIKKRAECIGLDPHLYSGHSLRAGFVTNATNKGASSSSIREQTGHQSDAMLQRYVRNKQIFTGNPNLKIW